MSRMTETSWMIGGPQGSGVDSSATLFARAMAVAGYWVYGKREYHSNIKGKHSYFSVRVNHEYVRSHLDPVHVLATFEDSTAEIHAHEIVPEGALIYDPSLTKPESLDLDPSVKLFPIDYEEIIRELAEEQGKPAAKLAIVKNTISVAAGLALYGVPVTDLEEALKGLFRGGKSKLVGVNLRAGEKAYELIAKHPDAANFKFKMAEQPNKPEAGSRLLMNGAAASGIGKLKAGCRMQTYYSITPAVDECIYLENHTEYGIVVYQAEDEISSINMANGAAVTGARVATATSGPGFCLKAEGIGWAGMNEQPTVIFNYQRGGPSTGLPTRNEQGDLLFALNIGHGDFPKIVMAPGDMEECFEDGFNCFNYAERYQTPVIVLVDKALANSTQTIPMFKQDHLRVDRGKRVTHVESYNPADPATGLTKYPRFKVTEDGVSPRPIPGTPGGIHFLTGDEHTEDGYITEYPEIRMAMMEKRDRKLGLASREIPEHLQFKLYGEEQADITIVGWGSTKGVAQDAVEELRKQGKSANYLHIRLMSPFPVEAVTRILNNAKKTFIIESNFSNQLAKVIRMETGIDIPHKAAKYTGRPLSQCEIVDAVNQVMEHDARKVVLSNGH
jgi:2-oxoglutarate/2-oxoacid ferredoxin oxidoreductase subunit alpha